MRPHRRRHGGRWLGRHSGLRLRQLDRERRAVAGHRLQVDAVAEHLADALDDRQAEAEAPHRARRLLEPLELLEDELALRAGDAGTGVADQDASRSPRRRTPSSTLPVAVYLMALDTRFCSTRRSSRRSERTHSRVGTMRSSSPFSRASGANSTSSRSNTSLQGKDGDVGLQPAGVEPRNLDQHVEDLLDGLERGVDVARQRRLLARRLALDQARRIEPCRVERLQHVVAGGRQEARLVEVGLVGLALGDRQRLVDLGELGRALPDAPLQRLVGARQRLGRLDALGDVGIGGDDAALGHRAGADLENAPAAVELLLERLVRHRELHQPVGDQLVDVAGAEVAALGAGAQDRRAARRPGRAPAADSSSSRNWRFQQISRMSLSNTLKPCRT